MKKDSKIMVLGANGLVGSSLVSRLENLGYTNVLKVTRKEADLLNEKQVSELFIYLEPEYVFLAAAKVGGIHANNSKPANFIKENLIIQTNVIDWCYEYDAKLLFLGSSCIYPKLCPQPIKEEYLMTGPLEPTNSAYAVAKIAGIEMCRAYNRQYNTNFICAMPTNLFGIKDNFDLETSHVLPAMIAKFHKAKQENTDVILWGSGSPRREFLYSEDVADALIFLMNNYDANMDNDDFIINVGTGKDCTIKELAWIIQDVTEFKGNIYWDASKPDGTPRKLLDVSKLKNLGWEPKNSFREAIRKAYEGYKENI